MPQLIYSQDAVIAMPGMPFDGEIFSQDKVSRICASAIPFGAYCEFDANGNAQLLQDATTLAGTVTLTNASASITFSTAQTLAAGAVLIFSDQPTMTYKLAAAVAASTSGTLDRLYSGTGGAGKLTTLVAGGNPVLANQNMVLDETKMIGISVLSPFADEEDYVPWSVATTLAGTVTLTNASPTLTFSQNQTLAAGTQLTFSDQPGVIYFVKTATSASTSATLTTNYTGTGGSGKTTIAQNGNGTAAGYKKGRLGTFMRRGRIWVLGDGAGTALFNGPINVNHSSTTGSQGVFTFTGFTQTAGSEVDVAPGCQIYQPGYPIGSGSALASSFTDQMGNTFFIYPVEINL